MNGYISKKALMEYTDNQESKSISNNDIARFPAADVVEVVRCKDCEYRMNKTKMVVHCALSGIQVDEDDFCSCGERRSE